MAEDNQRPHILIYVLCYTPELYERAKESYAKWSWARPVLMKYQDVTFENAFWRQLAELHNEWRSCDMVGTLSHRAKDKISMDNVDKIIRDPSKWEKTGYYHFMDTQARINNSCHPHLVAICKDVLASIEYYEPTESYCNYFMATPTKMVNFIIWFESVLKPAVLSHPLALTDSSYHRPDGLSPEQLIELCGVPYYPHVPFVIERLNKAFFLGYAMYNDGGYTDIETSPVSCKTLVLYVCHALTKSVQYFLTNGLFSSPLVDFVIIVNTRDLVLPIPSIPNVTVMHRDNVGYDFGAWADALYNKDRYKRYSHFVFVNSSVMGPFLVRPHLVKWPTLFTSKLSDDVRLVGTTVNFYGYCDIDCLHVQSMVFAVARDTLEYLMKEGIFKQGHYESDFIKLITDYECRMSQLIIAKGWGIACMMDIHKNKNLIRGSPIVHNNINRHAGAVKNYVKSPYEIIFVKSMFKDVAESNSEESVDWILSWAETTRKKWLQKV